MRRPPLALALALAAYLLVRGMILWTSFDDVCLPAYELYMGNIGRVALGGWYGAPLDQYYDNCGGHLATGLFATLPFALFGTTYLALKLVPLLLGVGVLYIIWHLLVRLADERAAALGAWLFALGPPTQTKFSIMAWGNHFENLPFQLLMIAAFLGVHSIGRERDRAVATPRALVMWGAATGFAVFFYFGTLAMVVLLALTHALLRGVKRSLSDLRWVLPGFAAGISPLIVIQLRSGARPGSFLDAKLGGDSRHGLGEAWQRLVELLTDLLPRGGVFEELGPIPGRVAEVLYLSAFGVAWLVVAVSLARPALASLRTLWSGPDGAASAEAERARLASLPFLAYLPAFCAIYAVSTFEFDAYAPPVRIGQFRYLVPHYTFACVLIALAVHVLARSGGLRRRLARALGAAALATGAFTLPIVDWSFRATDRAAHYEGYEPIFQANVLLRDGRPDPETQQYTWDDTRVVRQLGEHPLPDRHDVAVGLGNYRFWAQTLDAVGPSQGQPSLERLLAPFPELLHVDLARGVGGFLRADWRAPDRCRERIGRWLPTLVAEGHPLLPHVLEGLALAPDFWLARDTARELAHTRMALGLLPAEQQVHVWRGLGVMLGRLYARGVRSDVAQVRAATAGAVGKAPREMWFGFGFGAAEWSNAEAPPGWLTSQTPEAGRGAAHEGFGAGLRQRFGEGRCREILTGSAGSSGARSSLPASIATPFEEGMRWLRYPRPMHVP